MDVFDAIVAAKQKRFRPRLKGMRPKIETAYGSYLPLDGYKRGAFDCEDEERLRQMYLSSTEALAAVKVRIRRSRSENECPYCGIGPGVEFDHYLPQEEFPELAVLHHNLVWSCGLCNGKKLTDYTPGLRKVLHVYFDEVPDECQWLWVNVLVKPVPVLEYEIRFPPEVPSATASHIQRHFDRLGLLARYREETAGLVATCEDWCADADQIASTLRRTSKAKARRFGRNHWQAVALAACAESPEFIRWLEAKFA